MAGNHTVRGGGRADGSSVALMKIEAMVTREELLAFATGWLPLKLLLSGPVRDERYLLLDDPSSLELVAERGLRIVCRAQVRWPVLGLTVPVTVRELSALLTPSVEESEGQLSLVFRVRIEHAEFSGLPARFEATLADALNLALSERVKLSWHFGSMLTRSIAMPLTLATTRSLELAVRHGEVEVSANAFRFEIGLWAGTDRR